MQPGIVYHDGYVKIEYQYKGSRFRKSTGVAIISKLMLSKSCKLKSRVPDYVNKQIVIDTY